MRASIVLAAAAWSALAGAPAAAVSPSSDGSRAYIIAPADGATVSSPVTVVFGLEGMAVAPAGIENAGTGHHHLLVDLGQLPALDRPLPADANHRHFGAGQTETVLELAPGTHTLQLLLGDHTHTPHQPPVISQRITITVR